MQMFKDLTEQELDELLGKISRAGWAFWQAHQAESLTSPLRLPLMDAYADNCEIDQLVNAEWNRRVDNFNINS